MKISSSGQLLHFELEQLINGAIAVQQKVESGQHFLTDQQLEEWTNAFAISNASVDNVLMDMKSRLRSKEVH